MSVAGHIYGVILNDRWELDRLTPQFADAPYSSPPQAPVVFMKPRSSVALGPVRVQRGQALVASTTVALLIHRDVARQSARGALDCVGAACLALDLSLPQKSYYRPAIAQRNADGFLALGDWVEPAIPSSISLRVDDAPAHLWSLDRLVRPAAELLAELSAFMTIRAGDVLMIGLPGDAPVIQGDQAIRVEADGFRPLTATLAEQGA